MRLEFKIFMSFFQGNNKKYEQNEKSKHYNNDNLLSEHHRSLRRCKKYKFFNKRLKAM